MKNQKRAYPNKLKAFRENRGFTVEFVAKLFKLKQKQTIERWEKGESLPTLDNLLKLMALYETNEYGLYPILMGEIKREMDEKKRKKGGKK
jgi:transcriptional regulator with XRE-family HTH domain